MFDTAVVVDQDAAVVGVWLTDDSAKSKEYLPVAQQSLQFQATTLTCFMGEKAGPKGWNINADARATVVRYSQLYQAILELSRKNRMAPPTAGLLAETLASSRGHERGAVERDPLTSWS